MDTITRSGTEPTTDLEPAVRRRPRTAIVAATLSIAAFALLVSACGPAPSYLSNMNPVSGYASPGGQNIDGQWYYKSVSIGGNTAGYDVAYGLDGRFSSFKGVLGMTQNTNAAARFLVEVRGDGRMLWSLYVTPATVRTFNTNVGGVQRLEFKVYSNGFYGYTAWGDARLT